MKKKNIYSEARGTGITQAAASELIEKQGYRISEDRISRIESGKAYPDPEEVIAMSKAYKRPDLCNKYCATECPIGKNTIPQLEISRLSDIVLRMLSSLNTIESEKNRLIDITSDGRITDDEINDFAIIEHKLEQISRLSDTLRLWLDSELANGSIDPEKFKEAKKYIMQDPAFDVD